MKGWSDIGKVKLIYWYRKGWIDIVYVDWYMEGWIDILWKFGLI